LGQADRGVDDLVAADARGTTGTHRWVILRLAEVFVYRTKTRPRPTPREARMATVDPLFDPQVGEDPPGYFAGLRTGEPLPRGPRPGGPGPGEVPGHRHGPHPPGRGRSSGVLEHRRGLPAPPGPRRRPRAAGPGRRSRARPRRGRGRGAGHRRPARPLPPAQD